VFIYWQNGIGQLKDSMQQLCKLLTSTVCRPTALPPAMFRTLSSQKSVVAASALFAASSASLIACDQ
jgi:hypothetical protein